MAAGLGLLRLEPRAFWSMTPKEFAAALKGLNGPDATGVPPPRQSLTRMMEEFPDERMR